jgi:hypothetical protein
MWKQFHIRFLISDWLPVSMLAHQCPMQIVNMELANVETVAASFRDSLPVSLQAFHGYTPSVNVER